MADNPPKCPLHGRPMTLKGMTPDGFETFACGDFITRCSIEIDLPLSRPPAGPDPLHTDDPAEMQDPET
jgi:hypothetical protein